jgi:hypothetical protein
MSIKYRELFSKRDFTEAIDDRYVHSTKFYYTLFNNIGIETWFNDLHMQKCLAKLQEMFAGEIEKVYTNNWYNFDKSKSKASTAVVLMKNERMLFFQSGNCGVFVQDSDMEFVQVMADFFRAFREKPKKKANEVNLIAKGNHGLVLKEVEIKRTKLDLALSYEDDFMPVHETIFKRLNTKKDKGIVLLHGKPGTGKTTYLRYIIARIKKKVMFVPNNVAVNLTDPDFIDLLIDNPNSVLIIEDAEQVLKDRNESGHSAVSNLLNLADGLLADCLNTQIICSFNTEVGNIDSALMRKGRLIARYEFDRLSMEKAQRLSDSLGFNTVIKRPMTLSEIYGQNEQTFERQKNRIGFSLVA